MNQEAAHLANRKELQRTRKKVFKDRKRKFISKEWVVSGLGNLPVRDRRWWG